MIFEPPKIITDVSEADEPILKILSSKRAIDKFLKYDDTNTDETALITKMAIAARECCEKFLNISLAEKQIQVHFDAESVKRRNYRIELPYGPIKTIDEVIWIDSEGTTDDIDLNDGYNLFGNLFKEIQFFKISGTFISGISKCDYRVKYTVGYGIEDYTPNIPSAIEIAMMKLVYGWYHDRNNWLPVLTSDAENILLPFRRRAWF